jgi:hypothetical protein
MPGGKPLRLGPFIGGLNTGSDPTAIADAELVESNNLELDIDGSLVSRPPLVEIEGHSTFTERIIVLCEGVFSGSNYLIGSNTNGVFFFLGGAWTLITNTFRASAAVQYADKIYLVAHPSSANPGGKWDPSGGFVAVAAIPKGQAATIHKERLFIVPGGDASTNTSRVSFTDPGNFDVWPASNFIDIGQGDGTKLLDVTVYQDNILLFKNQSTYVLAYDIRPTDAVVRKISSTIGVDAQFCVANYENQVYCLHNGWVYEIINYDFNRLNTKVPFVNDPTSPSPFSTETEFLSLVGDRLIVRFFSRVYVYNLRTRTWCQWSSTRNPLNYFGPVVTLHPTTGKLYYAGSSVQDFRTLIQIFDDVDAVHKESTLSPVYTITDTYTRTTANGWGSADTGQVWTSNGGSASDFSTNGSSGLISHGTRNVQRDEALSGALSDFEAYLEISVGVVSLTNSQLVDIYFRRTSQNENYLLRFNFGLTGSLICQPYKTVAGVATSLTGTTALTNYGANDKYSIRIKCSGTSIKIRAWKTSIQEPTGWNVFNGTDAAQTSGTLVVSGIVDAANTNVLPVVYTYDNLQVGPLSGQIADIQCIARTKNFDMAIPNQFKRLWWWGVDVITNRDVVGTATPIVLSFAVTWAQLAAFKWNQLKTWAQPLTDALGVSTTVTVSTGTSRRFVKFLKSLRFRQINFKVMLVTDGSTADGPARLFTMLIITESKQGVVKGIT